MSVLPPDIVVYGSANMPEADGAINGGAIDFSRRVAFYDIAPAGSVDAISTSPSDTATKITFYGRDTTGVIQSQTLSLNGQTWVTGSQLLERLLYAALSGATANGPVANPGGTPAVGDVALTAHSCVLPIGSVKLTQRFGPRRADPPITPGRPRPCSSYRWVTEPTSPPDR
jgi:hypothetical protein